MNKLLKTLAIVALPFVILPFIMSACKKDPCEGVTCQNGGTCVGTGACSCATGYEGTTCEKQLVPTALIITNVTILKFPQVRINGQTWDIGSDADLFLSIETGGGSALWTPTSHYTDVKQTDLPLKIKLTNPLTIKNYGDPIFFRIYDYDTPQIFEPVGGLGTVLYSKSNPFTAKLRLGEINSSSTNVAFDIEIEYLF
jgi:hypothetical protein